MMTFSRDTLDVLCAGLWQGASIALVVAAVLALAGHRLNARTRCIVFQIAFVAIAIVPLATTLPSVTARASILRVFDSTGSSLPDARRLAKSALTVPRRIDVFLSDRTVLALTAAWTVGVLLFTLRIGAGSLQLARLLRRSNSLTNRDGVEVFASSDIHTPLAISFATPAIIVPDALGPESGEAFECIVLHELAHVRRGDAYMNAGECAIHAFLYFNPAILLLRRAIALERESACDDWAVARSRDLVAYTRSLASFAVLGANALSVAPYAPGFGHATLTRIQRLQDPQRNGAVALSKSAIGGFTFVLLTIALAFNAFAPAISFASQASNAVAMVASTACPPSGVRYVRGPAPALPDRLPNGLKTLVRVQVSPSGAPMSAVLFKTSGDPGFDKAVVLAAKKGAYAPEMRDCRPVAGSYLFEALTG